MRSGLARRALWTAHEMRWRLVEGRAARDGPHMASGTRVPTRRSLVSSMSASATPCSAVGIAFTAVAVARQSNVGRCGVHRGTSPMESMRPSSVRPAPLHPRCGFPPPGA